MIKLSIVIVSWNTADILAQCLESICAQPPTEPYEIWVVDNASSDGTPALLQSRFPQVQVQFNEVNIGFAAANNQAMRSCRGEYILLLNPDTIVHENALDILIQYLDENPQVGACGARLLNADSTLQHSCYTAPTLGREMLRMFHMDGRVSYQMEHWDTAQARPVEVLLGACILARREILESLNYMDESYFMYSEEVDLCYRIGQSGWQIHWVPQAEIVHLGGQSTHQVRTDMFLRLYQAKLLYMRKHYGRINARLYKFILLAASLARLSLTPVAWLERSPRREEHIALASRYWKLVKALPGY